MGKDRVRLFAKMDVEQCLTDVRFVAAGPVGFTLFWRGVAHSKLNLADGFVPKDAPALLCAGVAFREIERGVKALLDSGLWINVEGGYRTPEGWWEAEQMTAEQVASKRQKDADRKAAERDRRKAERDRLKALESQGNHEGVTRDTGRTHASVTATSREGTEHRAQSTDISPNGDMGPAPAPGDWKDRVDGRWSNIGPLIDAPEVIDAAEAFERSRGRPMDEGLLAAFGDAVRFRNPKPYELAGFLRQAVHDGLQTPNVQAFHRWMKGEYAPKNGWAQGTCNPGGNPGNGSVETEEEIAAAEELVSR